MIRMYVESKGFQPLLVSVSQAFCIKANVAVELPCSVNFERLK